jgi:hypothetical protein
VAPERLIKNPRSDSALLERAAVISYSQHHTGRTRPKGKTTMTAIADVVRAVEGLTTQQKLELIAGIRATIGSDTEDEIVLSAPLPSPLQAAKAKNLDPDFIRSLRAAKALAGRLGYNMRDDAPVDVIELNEAIKNKDIGSRMMLKEMLFKLGLLPR